MSRDAYSHVSIKSDVFAAWPDMLPLPNEVREYRLRADREYEGNAPQGELVWIEYEPRFASYGYAYLCYWPSESRDNHDGSRGGNPVRLSFRCRRDALEWYALNVTNNICPTCMEREKAIRRSAPWDQYCEMCGDNLMTLRDLEKRYKQMQEAHSTGILLYERIKELEEKLGDHDFTMADKASVLDRLLEEVCEA